MSIIKLAVTDSGLIAISDTYIRPSLSVINPKADGKGGDDDGNDGNCAPLVFASMGKMFRSAVFVNVSGRECLAASCRSDGTIHLWDTETRAFSVVYEDQQMIGRRMNICKIDDTTVAYGDVEGPEKGIFRVFVLSTNTKEWKVKNMLLLSIWAETIYDMCYLKAVDGTSCLVLSCPADDCVQVVEVVGGRIRWKSSPINESGKAFCPWSVCTDGHDTVYALDLQQNMLCVMSAEDGAAVRFIGLQPFGVVLPSCVRLVENHIYVAHRNNKTKAHVVSIFMRNMDIH